MPELQALLPDPQVPKFCHWSQWQRVLQECASSIDQCRVADLQSIIYSLQLLGINIIFHSMAVWEKLQHSVEISSNIQHDLLFKSPLFDNRFRKLAGTKTLVSLIRIMKIDPFSNRSYNSKIKTGIIRICQQLFTNAWRSNGAWLSNGAL